jgi:hypothetical protein
MTFRVPALAAAFIIVFRQLAIFAAIFGIHVGGAMARGMCALVGHF